MKINASAALAEAIIATRKETIARIEQKIAAVDEAAASLSKDDKSKKVRAVTPEHRALGKGDTLPEENAGIERIREIGMTAYVKEIKEKKLADIRMAILKSMGLTEETLAQLPAKQRNQIEDIISLEIRKYLATANNVEGDKDKKKSTLGYEPTQQSGADVRTDVISRITDIGPGIGVLLALQESEIAKQPEGKTGADHGRDAVKDDEKIWGEAEANERKA